MQMNFSQRTRTAPICEAVFVCAVDETWQAHKIGRMPGGWYKAVGRAAAAVPPVWRGQVFIPEAQIRGIIRTPRMVVAR